MNVCDWFQISVYVWSLSGQIVNQANFVCVCVRVIELTWQRYDVAHANPNFITFTYLYHAMWSVDASWQTCNAPEPSTRCQCHISLSLFRWFIPMGEDMLESIPRLPCYLFYTRGLFYKHGLTLIPALISNYMPGNVWGEITNLFLNFNACTVEVSLGTDE